MAATFDPALATKRDEARMWLGDYHTNASAGVVANAYFQDATYDAKIAAYTFPEAVAQLANALVSKYANQPDLYEEGHSLKLEWRARLATWRAIAAEARKSGAKPSVNYRPGIALGQMTNPVIATNTSAESKNTFRSN